MDAGELVEVHGEFKYVYNCFCLSFVLLNPCLDHVVVVVVVVAAVGADVADVVDVAGDKRAYCLFCREPFNAE